MRIGAIGVVMMFIGAAVLTTFLPAATAKVTPDNCLETEAGTWCSETVLSDTQKYDGVNIGDADNDGKLEILGVGLSGKVWMAEYVNKEWVTQTIWENPGELLLPYVGDADNDGKNEVVLATGKGDRTKPGSSYVVLVRKQ